MEKIFRKMTTGFLSLLLMSMMLVTAGVGTTPFISNNEANVAVVYGVNAAATDVVAADSIVNSLADGIITQEEFDRILSTGITEDEVVLGSNLNVNRDYRSGLTDREIDSLFDGKIYWDYGDDTDSYNVHEEIIILDGMEIQTTLDDNDFDGVVLINNKGLEYKLVFEEDIFIETGDDRRELGYDNAESLEVTILGIEYLIEDVDINSITITTASKIILRQGESIIVEGKTFTVDDIYSDSVYINGVNIEKGRKRTINGVKVRIENVLYRDSDIYSSKVELYIGGDISKEYYNRDDFIGQDEDDPEWVWSIYNPGKKDGWIGVKYNLRQSDEDDDVVYEGEEYTFPNDFATVRFDSLTEVDYYDYEVYFDKVDLYPIVGNGVGEEAPNQYVVVIHGEAEDSFELGENIETDTIYLRLVGQEVDVFYKDVAGDYSKNKAVYFKEGDIILTKVDTYSGSDCDDDEDIDGDDVLLFGETITIGDGTPFLCDASLEVTYPSSSVATLVADDTEMNVTISGIENITLSIEDIEVSLGGDNNFLYLGKIEEDAESYDVKVNGKSIGKYDNDVMNYYGVIIESPENNADDDRVVFNVPSERVYAQISVLGSEEGFDGFTASKPTPTELGIAKITDNVIATADGKNIIVVGGSCINKVAEQLLGGKYCGAEFTTQTGVSAGQVLIQTFDRGDGTIATLVAGYNAADTTRGVQYLLNNNVNIAVGEKIII